MVQAQGPGAAQFMGIFLPGEKPAQAYLDLGRTVCRRAEREVVALAEAGEPVRLELIGFLNDLSYLLWLMERSA